MRHTQEAEEAGVLRVQERERTPQGELWGAARELLPGLPGGRMLVIPDKRCLTPVISP